MIQATITCDLCGERDARDAPLTRAKKVWLEVGWRIFGDGAAFCPRCMELVPLLS